MPNRLCKKCFEALNPLAINDIDSLYSEDGRSTKDGDRANDFESEHHKRDDDLGFSGDEDDKLEISDDDNESEVKWDMDANGIAVKN